MRVEFLDGPERDTGGRRFVHGVDLDLGIVEGEDLVCL